VARGDSPPTGSLALAAEEREEEVRERDERHVEIDAACRSR